MLQHIARGLALAAALIVTTHARAQDPYQALRAYDGQNRQAQAAIQKAIQAAGQNRGALLSIETRLIGVIEDPGATMAGKRDACRFLWMVGSRKSVPALARMLTSAETADLAVYGLSRNPDPSAAAALRSALGRTSGSVRVGIVNALGNRADAASAPLLRRLATASDPILAEAATAALGKIGTPAALAALKALPVTNVAAGKAIVAAAYVLASKGSRDRAQAACLAVAHSRRSPVVRAAALICLTRLEPVLGARTAAAFLNAPDEYLAVVAARICGSTEDVRTRTTAISRFSTFAAPVQVALLAAWADHEQTAAAGVVLAALKATDPAVRGAAVRAAGRTAGSRAVAALAQIAAAGEGGDRDAAKWTLAAMPSKEADAGLARLVHSGAPEVRTALMAVLAERPTAESRALLLETARGSDANAASAALKGLTQVAEPADYPALIRILVGSRDDAVREAAREAVVAVSRLMPSEAAAADPILGSLNNASPEGRAAAMPALAEIGGEKALSALKDAAHSDNADLKQAAVGALADACSDRRALPILIDIAKNDPSKSIRIQSLRGAIRLAGSLDRVSSQERLGWLKSALDLAERPEEKRQAIGALRQCRVPEAVELAASYLGDADLSEDAASTIIALASRQDNRPGVRGPAVDAALDKVIATAGSDKLREEAKKLRGQ